MGFGGNPHPGPRWSFPNMPNDRAPPPILPTFDFVPPRDLSGRDVVPPRAAGLIHKFPPRRPVPSDESGPGEPGPSFPDHLFARPNSVLVYGPSRPAVTLALFALAEATNPLFQWVDIGVPGEERTPFDPVRLGWIPHERLWPIEHPDSLRPDDISANLALFGLIRSDEPPEALVQITEFLRLPETSQRIIAHRPNNGKPGVVAVANAHRVMASFPTSRVPPILSVHKNAGFSVVVGYVELVGPGRMLFDFVFRLECENVLDWKKGQLVCEKGITSGPLQDFRPVPLRDLPILSDIFLRATSSP